MASYTPTAGFRGQKITREATSTVEDTYTVTSSVNDGGAQLNLQIVPSGVGVFYHTTAGLTQTDGYPIGAGQPFTIPLGATTKFYLSAQSGTGTVDFVVL